MIEFQWKTSRSFFFSFTFVWIKCYGKCSQNTLNCALNRVFFLFIKVGEIDVCVVSQLMLPSNSDLTFPWFYLIVVLGTNEKNHSVFHLFSLLVWSHYIKQSKRRVFEKITFISMHVSKKNVPLRELCPKKMSQREENARINTTDDLEQFGHKLWQF